MSLSRGKEPSGTMPLAPAGGASSAAAVAREAVVVASMALYDASHSLDHAYNGAKNDVIAANGTFWELVGAIRSR